MNLNKDTIAAISTPIGEGGIGLVRISGRSALDVVGRMFVSPKNDTIESFLSHTIHYGTIRDKEEIVDEVLMVVMHSPRTYTTENMIEINCHGGISCVKRVLELCLENGARHAEPGEFT